MKRRPWFLFLAAALIVAAAMGACSPSRSPGEGGFSSKMKTIGVIGGISWESSITYYAIMNTEVRERLGGLNSASILMYSIDFGDFSEQERLAGKGDWEPLKATMIDAAKRLERGGADFIVIASNTMNSVAGAVEDEVGLPVLRIYDATGVKVEQSGIERVALLGTSYTMEQPFYRDALKERFGIEVVVPDKAERDYINHVIFDELCAGKIEPASRERYVQIVNRMVSEDGVQGVILGCTEIPLLVDQDDVSVPVFDTTRIHAEAAVDYAMRGVSRQGWFPGEDR